MGIVESILRPAEGLNPSYAGIAAQQAAGNQPVAIEWFHAEISVVDNKKVHLPMAGFVTYPLSARSPLVVRS